MITVEHDENFIMLSDDLSWILLSRDEAIALRDQLASELQKMPVPGKKEE